MIQHFNRFLKKTYEIINVSKKIRRRVMHSIACVYYLHFLEVIFSLFVFGAASVFPRSHLALFVFLATN